MQTKLYRKLLCRRAWPYPNQIV